jgi:pregnane X receptor
MDTAIQKKKDAAAGLSTSTRSMADKYAVVKPVERPPVPEVSPPQVDEELDRSAILLQRLLRGRAQQNAMFAAKEKRAELIKELRLSEVINDLADEIKIADAATAEKKLKEDAVASSVAAVQGEMVGTTLQFLSTELIRLREERKIQAMAMLAERTRRLREAEEGGKRASELESRTAEDERFRKVMQVRAGTVDKYLTEVIGEQLERVADDTAAQEALHKAEKINGIVDQLEERYNRPEVIVQDLLASFLLPEVDRQLVREEIAVDQAKVSLAVRDALSTATEQVCQEVPAPEHLQQ